MTLLLKQLFAFIKLLNSETGTNQIAAGIAAGFVMGMSPMLSLQTLLVFIFIFVFRIQAGAAFVAAFFFKFVAYLFDTPFDLIGRAILTNPAFNDIFTALYNMPVVPLTRFNNTIVMGAGVVTLVCFPLVFWGAKILVLKYRVTVVARIKETKIWKAVQATSLYKWYYSYDQYFG